MDKSKGFLSLEIVPGLLTEYSDGNFESALFGFTKNSVVNLPGGYTHFGIVIEGEIQIHSENRSRKLYAGDFFSVIGNVRIESAGFGMVNSAKAYKGFNVFGGPIESAGRLRYIDGCTDTLLVPPVRKGDPCFNHLHFPAGITQTPHSHPSVRTGVVLRGSGECVIPEENKVLPLVSGQAFIIKTGTLHSFNTIFDSMDVIAFHPDSDTGMTDEDHPMINRTMVNGVSAREISDIQTQETSE